MRRFLPTKKRQRTAVEDCVCYLLPPKGSDTPRGKTVILPFAVGIRKRSRSAKINGPTVARNVFFCYLCLDDSPACGLFALLHVKTATFKCRGEGARMLRELSAHGPQREVLTCLLSKLRVTGVGSSYLYSAWVVADLHVSMGILGPAPFFFESAGPAIRTGG